MLRYICFLLAVPLLGACVTPGPTVSLIAEPTQRPAITIIKTDRDALGTICRELGAASGKGIVLMYGIEARQVGPYDLRNADYGSIVRRLAADADCEVLERPDYFFLHPPGYAQLGKLSLRGTLHARYQQSTAAVVFGAGTPLHQAFAILGQATETTIVADNAIAAARTGELALDTLSLDAALEAILQSARVPSDVFQLESTEEFIFIRSTGNLHPETLLRLGDGLTRIPSSLERRVNLILPDGAGDGSTSHVDTDARPLRSVLASLSEQLGMRVEIDHALSQLPVNPVVMNNVRIRTAMDLLIRQWLRPDFVYEVTDTGLRIRADLPVGK
ncbi:MAG: hypothetical protein IID08_04585 [Candidatus Hydrogenedentes bacterium]|nr:hypothetical protein [Candidatus Hydrogenedentota bacterium]